MADALPELRLSRQQTTPIPLTCVNRMPSWGGVSNHDTPRMATDLSGCTNSTLIRALRTRSRIALRSQAGRQLAHSSTDIRPPVSRLPNFTISAANNSAHWRQPLDGLLTFEHAKCF